MGRVLVQLPKEKPLRDRAAGLLRDALGVELPERLVRWDGWVLQIEGERRVLPRRGWFHLGGGFFCSFLCYLDSLEQLFNGLTRVKTDSEMAGFEPACGEKIWGSFSGFLGQAHFKLRSSIHLLTLFFLVRGRSASSAPSPSLSTACL